MKRNLAVILIILSLIGLIGTMVGCGSQAQVVKSQTVTAQRGNLTLNITAAGNLALSNKQDLAIEISGTQQDPVTVQEVLVKEGDSVKAAQVLVRLNVTALEDKVTAQQRAVKTAEQAVATAQTNLSKTTEDGQIKIKTAEFDLETATINFNKLNYPFNYATFAFDVPAATEDMKLAQQQMESAQAGLAAGPGSDTYGTALDQFRKAQSNLATALERLLKGQAINVYDSGSVSKTVADYLTARAANIAMEKAQYSLDQTKSGVQIDIDRANLTLENAKEDLNDATDTLADYKNDLKKSEIAAPFDGFITKVNVSGGDQVQKGTVAVQLADPTKFEAEVMVSEMDISQVKLDGEAAVAVSAMAGLSLPAKVTRIAPTATVQSGVVNLKVKVEIQSIAAVPSDFQLREGITVTVSITVQKKTDVLLVPYAAISSQGGQSYVQVVSASGAIEKRAIKTGITDYKNTEVTEGLQEGDKLSITQGSSATPSTSTTTKTSQPAGGIMIPGVGGPPR